MKNKIYPNAGYDDHGIKFFFDMDFEEKSKKHFTVRFAGNPMLILEYLFLQRGGKDFGETYERAKTGIKLATAEQTLNAEILRSSVKDVKEFMDALALMSDNDKSPFVIYVNDYSSNR